MTRPRTILVIFFSIAMGSAQLLWAQEPAPAATPGNADDEPEEEVAAGPSMFYGIKGGLNAGWLSNDDSTMDERFGPVVGLFAALQFGGPFGLQVEALYSSKGYKSDTRAIILDYIEVPILASVRLPRLGPVRPLLLTGPAGAMRVRTRYGTAKTSTQDAFRADVRRWDVGWIAGAALEFALPSGAVTIEARYNIGLTTMFVEDSPYGTGNDKNRGYIGLIGYRF